MDNDLYRQPNHQNTETSQTLFQEFCDSAPMRFIADNRVPILLAGTAIAAVGAYWGAGRVARAMSLGNITSDVYHLQEGFDHFELFERGVTGVKWENLLQRGETVPGAQGEAISAGHDLKIQSGIEPTQTTPKGLANDNIGLAEEGEPEIDRSHGRKLDLVFSQNEPQITDETLAKRPPELQVISHPDENFVAILDALKMFRNKEKSLGLDGMSTRQFFGNLDKAEADYQARHAAGGFMGYSESSGLGPGKGGIIRDPDVAERGRISDDDLLARAERQFSQGYTAPIESRTPMIYQGPPLPVDFDQQALMRAHRFVPSLDASRPDIRFGVESDTEQSHSYHNNIFSAMNNAKLIQGSVYEVGYLDGKVVRLPKVKG